MRTFPSDRNVRSTPLLAGRGARPRPPAGTPPRRGPGGTARRPRGRRRPAREEPGREGNSFLFAVGLPFPASSSMGCSNEPESRHAHRNLPHSCPGNSGGPQGFRFGAVAKWGPFRDSLFGLDSLSPLCTIPIPAETLLCQGVPDEHHHRLA